MIASCASKPDVFVQLAVNEDLWQRLSVQTTQILLPEWVPQWAQTVVFLFSPLVQFTADFIIRFAGLLDLLPDTPRRIIYLIWLGGARTAFNLGREAWAICYEAARRLRAVSDSRISIHGSYAAAFALCVASAIALGSILPSAAAPMDSSISVPPTNLS